MKKEGVVNSLTGPLERRSTLMHVIVYGWVGEKYACVDLTGVLSLVGRVQEFYGRAGNPKNRVKQSGQT